MATTPSPEMQPSAPVLATVVRTASASPPRRGLFARLLTALLGLVFGGSILLNLLLLGWVLLSAMQPERKVQEKYISHNTNAVDKVAVITVQGLIREDDEGFVKRQIDQVTDDKHVKAVVLRVDSPGGTVTGSDYIYHHLRKMLEKRKIPIVVSMGGMAASGGYYVSMAVGHEKDCIFIEPTGFTGSIGVILPHYNFGGLMKEHGVEEDSVVSRELKNMGTLARPMTEKEREVFQALIDTGFARFKDIVCAGRAEFDKDRTKLDSVATGQVFAAEQAQKEGLVDRLGFLEDAVDRVIELAGLDKNQVKVVKYKQETSLVNMILGEQSRSREPLGLRMLEDLSSPRAYYLCTWLPALASSQEQ